MNRIATALRRVILASAVGLLIADAVAQTAPFAASQPATFITSASAQLNGMAVPNGLPSVAWFEWGARGSYDQQTSPVQVGSGTAVVPVSTSVAGLTNGGVYQSRLVVSNAVGVTRGFIQILTTGRRLAMWGADGRIGSFTNAPSNAVAVSGGDQLNFALTSQDGTVFGWLWNSGLPGPILTNAVSIAAGGNDGVALLADGTVTAWGDNRFGQTNVPAGLTNVALVAAGEENCFALKTDGTLSGWGTGALSIPPGLSNLVGIASGFGQAVALKADGTVVGWGLDVPSGLSNVVAVAAGWYFAIALKTDGTLVGWPGNPQPIASNVVAIAASSLGAMALTADGSVFGGGSLTNIPPGISNVVAVASGNNGGYAIGPNFPPAAQNKTVSGTANAQVVVALSGTDANGDVLGFRVVSLPSAGALYQYAAGFAGDPITNPNTPVADPGGRLIFVPSPNTSGEPYTSFDYVANDGELDSPAATVTVAVVARPYAATQPAMFQDVQNAQINGMVVPNGFPTAAWFEWGPKGSFSQVTAPHEVGSNASVVHISAPVGNLAAGTVYQCRLVASNEAAIVFGATRWFGFRDLGKVTAWGDNTYGQRKIPAGLTNVVALATGGGYHNLALKADGTVVAWGWNAQGQTNVPPGLRNVVAIGGGDHHSLALKSDGTVVAWGWNQYGETNVPPGLSNVVAVTGGGDQSLALKSDGTVVAWGANSYGQATVPPGLSNVVAVAGGWHHSLALKADGTVVGWGYDGSGQTNNPAGLTNAVAIASSGGDFNLALRSDGTVFAWGDNSSGQCNNPPGVSNVVAIGASASDSLAVAENETLAVWGDIGDGETHSPAGLSNVVSATGGSVHVVAMCDNLPPLALGQTVSGYPNHDLLIRLSGSDPNGDELNFRITTLPTAGALYQSVGGVRGEAITNVETAVSDPSGFIIFAAGPNALGAPYDTFTYVANDGEADSAYSQIQINITLPAPPLLSATGSRWDSTNGFELNFSGNSNATYRVWASSNLVDWTELGFAISTTSNLFEFIDTEATNLPQRFYKAGVP